MYSINNMNISNIDLNLLVVFKAIYEHRSISIAATRLHLSQPTISHALNRLRDTFQDELFIRSNKGMIPSVKAKELGPFIIEQLSILDRGLFQESEFIPKLSEREFTLCGTDYDASLWMADLSAHFQKIAPKLRLSMNGIDIKTYYENMTSGAVDFSFGVNIPKMNSIHKVTLAHHKYCVLTREDNPHINKRLSLKKYAELDHLLFAPTGTAGGIVDLALESHGLKRNVAVRIPYLSSAPWFLLERDLLLTIPERYAEKLLKFLPLKRLAPPIEIDGFDHQMIWHKRVHNSEPHIWLRRQIQKFAK